MTLPGYLSEYDDTVLGHQTDADAFHNRLDHSGYLPLASCRSISVDSDQATVRTRMAARFSLDRFYYRSAVEATAHRASENDGSAKIFACDGGQYDTHALPMIDEIGTGPKTRESLLLFLLSPITKT